MSENCEHGKNPRNCYGCFVYDNGLTVSRDHEKRISALEHFPKFQMEYHNKVFDRIKALEEYMKLEDRITASDILNRLYDVENSDHDERLSSLEEMGIEQRLLRIEKCLGTLLDNGNILRTEKKEPPKVPHMCPVCKGEVKILIDPATPLSGIEAMFGKRDINGMSYKECTACEGKGIVWG